MWSSGMVYPVKIICCYKFCGFHCNNCSDWGLPDHVL
jgi:hypothetical protein